MVEVKCANCRLFKPIYGHGKGPGSCPFKDAQGVICLWDETERECKHFEKK